MTQTLPRDALDLIAEFARHGVDALVVGGWAVALHGRPRATKDVDIWLRDDPDGLQRAVAALAAFGAPPVVLRDLLQAQPMDVVWMGRPPNRVDLLRNVPGGDFADAWATRVELELDGVKVQVVGLEQLIALKEASGRPVDLEDAELLRVLAGSDP